MDCFERAKRKLISVAVSEIELQLSGRAVLIDHLHSTGKAREAEATTHSASQYCIDHRHAVGQAVFLLKAAEACLARSDQATLECVEKADSLLKAGSPDDISVSFARASCCQVYGQVLFAAHEVVSAEARFRDSLALASELLERSLPAPLLSLDQADARDPGLPPYPYLENARTLKALSLGM